MVAVKRIRSNRCLIVVATFQEKDERGATRSRMIAYTSAVETNLQSLASLLTHFPYCLSLELANADRVLTCFKRRFAVNETEVRPRGAPNRDLDRSPGPE